MQYNTNPQGSTGYLAPSVSFSGQTQPYQQSSTPNSYVTPGTNILILALTPRFKNFLIISGVLHIILGIIILSLQSALIAQLSVDGFAWYGIFIILQAVAIILDGILMIATSRKLSYAIKPIRKMFTSTLTLAILGIFFCVIYLVLVKTLCDKCNDNSYFTLVAAEFVFFAILTIYSIICIIFIHQEQKKMLT